MIESAIRTASTKLDIRLSVSGDLTEYEHEMLNPYIYDLAGEWESTVYRWNNLAQEVMKRPAANLFMLAADDVIFSTPGWDEALLDHYKKLENKIHVYALRDSRSADGTPHPIVTREWINALGYFLPPLFFHWFVDSWTVEIARDNGCFTHLTDYELIHDKCNDRGQADETHNRIRKMGWHYRDQAVNASCKHFLALEKQRLAKAIAA